jgi:hypothetical protein
MEQGRNSFKMVYRICIYFLLFLILFSCKDKTEDCTDEDYRNCDTSRPEYGYVDINLSFNHLNPDVILRIYEGNFEDNRLLLEQSVRSSRIIEELRTNTYYSFTATYQNGREIIVAVDGGKIKIDSYQMCEYKCYEARRLNVDLRIN